MTLLAAISAAWSLAVFLTGGFATEALGVAVSSRNPRNAALVAVLSAVVAVALPTPNRRRATRDLVVRWRRRAERVRASASAHAAVAIAAFGAGILVVAWAGARPLWLDEQMIALNVRDRSLAQLAGPLWLDQTAPFGWLALERTMLVAFGTGERTMRLVPVVFGIATLALAAWAGRRWLSPAAAALFVLVCAVSPWLAHYPLELKPYSADAFWALLLPALAVWVVEGRGTAQVVHRARLWWALAAVGQWFANGTLLVTPACALLLLYALWRRSGWRGAFETVMGGVVFIASFALHFMLSIRHTLASDYLRSYWSGGLPPESSGVLQRLAWVSGQFVPLAANPLGTEYAVLLWVLVAIGWLVAPGSLRWVLVMVPATGFVLGGLGVVPLLDRVALWMVPLLYFGIALAADRAFTLLRSRQILLGLALASAVAVVAGDIVVNGWAGVESRSVRDRNHGLDDRSAVEWLLAARRPDDVLVTTHLALPAMWWYGRLQLDAAIVEAAPAPATDCSPDAIASQLNGYNRALVYVGFPDAPSGFSDHLLREIGRGGRVEADRIFADASRAAVISLGRPRWPPSDPTAEVDAVGCVFLKPAARW